MDQYHQRQYCSTYESTVSLFDFLKNSISSSAFADTKKILDVGCGAGANTFKLSEYFNSSSIIGIDNNLELIEYAKQNNKSGSNIVFELQDLFNIKYNNVDGIIAIQTISWVPSDDIYDSLEALLNIRPRWICFSSLGFDGNADAAITITNFSESGFWMSPYNILSNNKIVNLAKKFSYSVIKIEPYVPKNAIVNTNSGMGSYTKALADGSLYFLVH